MKKTVSKSCRCVLALLLAGMLLLPGCTLMDKAKPYLDFKFTDCLKMTDGVLWGVPCAYTRVTSSFGHRDHPTTGEWLKHKGIDLASPEGTPIYASRSGKVVFAGWDITGGGNYVSLDHQDGYKTQYMHMKEFVVQEGQEVKMGEIIGYVGDTGVATGFHLHFVIRKWNPETAFWDWMDPTTYLDLK